MDRERLRQAAWKELERAGQSVPFCPSKRAEMLDDSKALQHISRITLTTRLDDAAARI